MKKSIGLLSALVVSTTFIVNCQKAPDKRRVRPSGGSGAGVQTDIANEKAKLPTKICSKEVLDLYKAYYKNKEAIKKTVISAASTETEKESYKKLGVETLAKCDDIITSLKTEKNEGCFMDNGVKDTSNALMAANMQNECNGLGKKLKTDVDLDSSYYDAAKELEIAKANAKAVEEKFIGKNGQIFTMTKEARQLVLSGNTDGGKFLVNGEIRSSNTALEQAVAASSTVCTFLGEGLQIEENADATLKIVAISAAEKADLHSLKSDFTGKATLLSTEVTQGEDKSIISLLCLNLDAAKLSVDKIEGALGSEIHRQNLAATQQAAEDKAAEEKKAKEKQQETAHASDKLAAAQPEGSPQQKILDQAVAPSVDKAAKEAEQKAAEQKAAQEKAAADKKAKEEAEAKAAAEAKAKEEAQAAQKPAVTLVPAAGVSSPAAAANAEAEGKVTKEELASMKEKAERLEKEAKDAEAEVAKLETEKAKAEDIDQAKAKARIARESANSAKADYEAAAKA